MKRDSREKRNFVAAHKDYPKDNYQYDVIPLDIDVIDHPSFEKEGTVPEENGTELGAVPEDVIEISDLMDGEKDVSIVQGLLDDHDSQGYVVKDKVNKIVSSTPELYDKVPWKKCLNITSPTLRLHEEIKNFCSCLEPTQEEAKARSDALNRIEEIVKALWPESRLELFGSFATGLYLPTSDIDAVILDSKCVDIRQGLKVLGKALSQKGIAIDIQTILKARVPIIKFEEKQSGYQFDISFDAYNGPEAAENVRTLSEKIPAMSALTMVLKVFLQQRDLNEVYSGGIGSYALLVMVANFLQMHWSRFNGHQGDLNTNLGELLLDFFRLHGRALKLEVVGLSCSSGGQYFKKRSKSFHYPERPELPAVQDPNDDENDLGKNSYNAGKVRMAFDYAYTKLLAAIKPGESMLQRIIRLDPVIFSRYQGSDRMEKRHETKGVKRKGEPKGSSGSKRGQGQKGKQFQPKKKSKKTQNIQESNVLEFWEGEPLAYGSLFPPSNDSLTGDVLPQSYKYDVIIVGAGMAGLSAAMTLCEQEKNVLVLEANNKLGGRIFSTHFEGSSIELGAQFLLGGEKNPLSTLCNLAGVKRAKELRRGKEMRLLREISYNAVCREFDLSDQAGLCPQMKYKHDDVCLGSLERSIHYMASLLESNQCNATILKNQTVSKISSNEVKSSVATIGGDVFDASYILSTIPLGVLQQSTSMFLEPSLPSPLKVAIKNLEVVKVSIIHILSNLSIPDPYYTIDLNISSRRATIDILNLHSFTGDGIVVIQATDEVASFLESLSESEVIEVVVDGINKHFDTHVHVRQSLISHWGRNPYTLGAYSKLSSCSTSSDRATLRQPIGGRIVLAGEWVASKDPGTIHGAYQSGVEQATLLIQDGFEAFETAENECECESI